MTFREFMLENGYELQTTFYSNSGRFFLEPYTKDFGRITYFRGNDLATVPFAAFCLD